MARRRSPSEVQCYAPALEAGSYPLELSLNDQDYTDRRFPFLFFDDQVIPPCSLAISVAQKKAVFLLKNRQLYGRAILWARLHGLSILPAHSITFAL